MLDDIVRRELSQDEMTEINIEELVKYNLILKKSEIMMDSEIKKEELRILSDLAESLFELRLSKFLEGKEAKGFDEYIFDIIKMIKQYYIELFTGKYFINYNKIYCKALKSTIINNYKVDEGDIVLLPMREALPLIIARYLTPYKIDIEEQ
ncbi:hypothetical protein [Saccharolobus caldissimus]|uniref:Uncharacterized protein n=1 Tax=Saccharolobus caldissimus TaxID=1702097 RepID=A0AAQ4CQ32_9CREN|nr:hypothetical protein [Saccharolobus caldissimus]BDB97913.1 hypothetical protein SACC_09300 [Saccharolobus caldissimus]